MLKVDWTLIIERGDSRRNLPWNIGQFGSNTNFTKMARTNYVAAMDALNKLKGFGGNADHVDVDGKRVFRKVPRHPE